MKSAIWICKKNEIACHIRKLFMHFGEDMGYFEEYLNYVMQHPADDALECFREVVKLTEGKEPYGRKKGS